MKAAAIDVAIPCNCNIKKERTREAGEIPTVERGNKEVVETQGLTGALVAVTPPKLKAWLQRIPRTTSKIFECHDRNS